MKILPISSSEFDAVITPIDTQNIALESKKNNELLLEIFFPFKLCLCVAVYMTTLYLKHRASIAKKVNGL